MSINLTSINHILELVTTDTGAVHVVTSFIDDNAGTKTGGSQTTVISSATTTTVVSAPGASVIRAVHHINVMAVAGNTVTIQKNVEGTDHTLIGPVTLSAGERLEFTASVGWSRTNASGSTIILPSISDDTFLANTSGVNAPPVEKTFTSLAGDGIAYNTTTHALDVTYTAGDGLTLTGTEFDVGGSTSIIVGDNDVQRAALTGEVTAAQNSNATTITRSTDFTWTGKHQWNSWIVLGTQQNETAFTAGALNVTLADNVTRLYVLISGDGEIQTIAPAGGTTTIGRLVYVYIVGTGTKTIKHAFSGGGSGRIQCPGNVDFTAGNRESFILVADGANGWLASLIPEQAIGLTDGDKGDIVVSSSGATWTIDSSVAGAGLTGGGGSPLAVGAGSFITVSADSVAVNLTTLVPAIDSTSIIANGTVLERAALTGAVTSAQNSNTTVFDTNASGAGLTGGGTAVLAVGAGTYITVNANDVAVNRTALAADLDSTSVVNNAGVLERAAIIGDIQIAQNSNTATIPNDTVTNAKAADMAANTLKANPTASTADPQDLAIAANGVPFRVGSANLASHAPGPHQVLASDGDGETDWRDAGTLLDATHYILRDDFSGGEQGFSSGTYGETGWKRVRNTDAGEEIVGVTDEVGHPGVVELELTTDTVDATVALVRGRNDFTAAQGEILHGDLDFFEFVVRVPSFQADTGAQFQVGFGADPLDDDNNGEGVYFSLNLDTNGEPWIGVCRAGGSSDTTPTLVAGSLSWVRLTARKTATHWLFSANGGTEEAVPLSNAPADIVRLGAFARIRRIATGGGDHRLRVDFVRAHGTLTR